MGLTKDEVEWLVHGRGPFWGKVALRGLPNQTIGCLDYVAMACTHAITPRIAISINERQSVFLQTVVASSVHLVDIRDGRDDKVLARGIRQFADLGGVFQCHAALISMPDVIKSYCRDTMVGPSTGAGWK